MRKSLLLTIAVCALFCMSCDPIVPDGEGHRTCLTIHNRSEIDLYSCFYCDSSHVNFPFLNSLETIHGGETALYRYFDKGMFEIVFEQSRKVFIVFLDAKTAHACPIRINHSSSKINPLDERYSIATYVLSKAKLEKLNWTLSFPPDESMKGIEIFFNADWEYLKPDWMSTEEISSGQTAPRFQ